jgi:hypothetical protein
LESLAGQATSFLLAPHLRRIAALLAPTKTGGRLANARRPANLKIKRPEARRPSGGRDAGVHHRKSRQAAQLARRHLRSDAHCHYDQTHKLNSKEPPLRDGQ